jgi:molecular chaperone GrpE (heat shock protein)
MMNAVSIQERMKKSSDQLGQLSLQLIKARQEMDDLLMASEEYRRQCEDENRGLSMEYDRLALRVLEILDDFVAEEFQALAPEERLGFLKTRLEDAVGREGITTIDASSEPFDPKKYEVVETVEDAERPEGTILGIIRPGYVRGGRVIRKTGVVITRKGS